MLKVNYSYIKKNLVFLKRTVWSIISLVMLTNFNLIESQEDLSGLTDNLYPVWSPDGSKIAFSAKYHDYDICVMNTDGSERKRLINKYGDDSYPAWSPDGKKILFRSIRYRTVPVKEPVKYTGSIFFIADSDGSNVKPLIQILRPRYAAWSPDANKMAFTFYGQFSTLFVPNGLIIWMNPNADSTDLFLLEDILWDRKGFDYNLSWSANGKIALSSDRDRNREIYILNGDSKKSNRLTKNPAYDDYPMLSPDGEKIAFVSNRDGNMEIYVMNTDGKNLRRLTNNPADDLYPSWSPDGLKIVFSSNRVGNYEIFVMDEFGKNEVRLSYSGKKSKDSRIREAYKAFALLNDIDGAIYDSVSDQPILFAEVSENKNASPLNLDDLLNLIKVFQGMENPGLIIAPLGTTNIRGEPRVEKMLAEAIGRGVYQALVGTGRIPFFGPFPFFLSFPPRKIIKKIYFVPLSIADTNLGNTLIDINIVIDGLLFENDEVIPKDLASRIEGYHSLPKLVKMENEDIEEGWFGVFRLKNREPQVRLEGEVIYIDDIEVDIESESPYPVLKTFTSHFKENFEEFAKELPVFQQAKQTYKIASIAKWLIEKEQYKRDIRIQSLPYFIYESINNGKPWRINKKKLPYKRINSEQKIIYTDVEKIQGRRVYLGIEIIINSDNNYLPGGGTYINGVAFSDFEDIALNARPHQSAVCWDFIAGEKVYRAVALPF